MENRGRKSLELLVRLEQPVEHSVGIDLEDALGAPNAHALGESGDDLHD